MNQWPALRRLAQDAGLYRAYRDISGRRQHASTEGILATLRALGIPIRNPEDAPRLLRERWHARLERRIEPVQVWVHGQGPHRLCLYAPSEPEGYLELVIRTETGETTRMRVPLDERVARRVLSPPIPDRDTSALQLELSLSCSLPIGYHDLDIHYPDGRVARTLLMVRPPTVLPPETVGLEASWGVFLPLYALWRDDPTDGATYSRLQELVAWVRSQHGTLVGTLPLLPTYLGDDPYDPSPYAPVSRLLWSEFFLDHDTSASVGAGVSSPLRTVPGDTQALFVDYRASWQQRFAALAAVARDAEQRPESRTAIQAWLHAHPQVSEYARFRATVDRFGRPSRWPASRRADVLAPDRSLDDLSWTYAVAQWLASRRIAETGPDALYLDLPLGVHPEGFDVWRWPHLFADGASAGAPPDPFFAGGQVWGFPPLHPERVREDGYRYVRAVLAHHLGAARLLRIDHVMGFHRLYWVPQGASGRDGVYVRYPAEEYYAVLAIESHRARCAVAGEDLGTVPPSVRSAMARNRLLRLWVLPFERRDGEFTPPPPLAVASLDTHDLPPFATLWDEWSPEVQRSVIAWLTENGYLRPGATPDLATIVQAFLRFLGTSEAAVVLVNLEDLWGERLPHNRPGTGLEEPNWRRLSQRGLSSFFRDPAVVQLLRTLDRSRRGDRDDDETARRSDPS